MARRLLRLVFRAFQFLGSRNDFSFFGICMDERIVCIARRYWIAFDHSVVSLHSDGLHSISISMETIPNDDFTSECKEKIEHEGVFFT